MRDKLRTLTTRIRHMRAVLNGSSRRGQSLVELTLTAPILLLLLFGMIEVGWYVNSYLILLDATREGGRQGATADPIMDWNLGLSNEPFRHDCCVGADCDEQFLNQRPEMQAYYQAVNDYIAGGSDADKRARLNGLRNAPFRYFDAVACRVLFNMPPLEFKWDQDEIVVSVFSYVPPYDIADYPQFSPYPAGWSFSRIAPSYPGNGGRFPLERNQCQPSGGTIEHIGFTLTGVGNDDCTPDGAYPGDPEAVCGRCDQLTGQWCANHMRSDNCYGSEWDPGEIEERLYESEGRGLGGAVVLVEIFWWHEQLLGMPFFSSIENPTEIYVWVMFPVSAAEPTPTIKP